MRNFISIANTGQFCTCTHFLSANVSCLLYEGFLKVRFVSKVSILFQTLCKILLIDVQASRHGFRSFAPSKTSRYKLFMTPLSFPITSQNCWEGHRLRGNCPFCSLSLSLLKIDVKSTPYSESKRISVILLTDSMMENQKRRNSKIEEWLSSVGSNGRVTEKKI